MATRKTTAKYKEPTNVAQEIWEKIKDLPLDLFALPNQTVSKHVVREEKLEKVNPDALHLVLKSDAVYPALEETLGKVRLGKDDLGQPLVFSMEKTPRYTVVKIVPRDI